LRRGPFATTTPQREATPTGFAMFATRVQAINRPPSAWTETTTDADALADSPRLRDEWHQFHAVRLALLTVAAGELGAVPAA
jgi:hypothetical protein